MDYKATLFHIYVELQMSPYLTCRGKKTWSEIGFVVGKIEEGDLLTLDHLFSTSAKTWMFQT